MNRILTAELRRLKKDKILWTCIIVFVLFSIFIIKMLSKNPLVKIENVIFWGEMIIGIAISVFTCLFVGEGYSSGTIKNKIIVGHSRLSIYFSNLIISVIAGIIINLAYTVPTIFIGLLLFGEFVMPAETLLQATIDIIFMIICFSSIFNMIAMLFSNKTNGAVISILLIFGLMFISTGILNKLLQPEYVDNVIITDGNKKTETVKNPSYVEGKKRENYQLILDILPTGQSMQIVTIKEDKFGILYLYSSAVIIIINSVGYFIFKNKNLN